MNAEYFENVNEFFSSENIAFEFFCEQLTFQATNKILEDNNESFDINFERMINYLFYENIETGTYVSYVSGEGEDETVSILRALPTSIKTLDQAEVIVDAVRQKYPKLDMSDLTPANVFIVEKENDVDAYTIGVMESQLYHCGIYNKEGCVVNNHKDNLIFISSFVGENKVIQPLVPKFANLSTKTPGGYLSDIVIGKDKENENIVFGFSKGTGLLIFNKGKSLSEEIDSSETINRIRELSYHFIAEAKKEPIEYYKTEQAEGNKILH